MARPPRSANPSANPGPADDWVPTQPVANPILNRPYDEPTRHWLYEKGIPREVPTRRPASYYYITKKIGTRQEGLWAEERADRLELVNRLRADVGRWRAANYKGASNTTKALFAYWFHPDRPRRLFFCQREAVETLIYLLELGIPGHLGRSGFRKFDLDAEAIAALLVGGKPAFVAADAEHWPRLVDPAVELPIALRRLGCRMATGSGKTLVMAMLITWAFCNRGVNGASTQYPNAVLVCAPNLTVRTRLQVLRPGEPGNYYDLFDLVPRAFADLLGMGKVLVTNWHAFAPKSEHREGDTTFPVVQKGEETPEAFTRDRLAELAHRLPILVLNDEGHHCWRPKPDATLDLKDLSPDEKAAATEDAEEARVWLAGLDRINNSGLAGKGLPGILATIDLSATPFYLGNSGYPEGSPFPWLVSDFGLVDAIESGIVKVPRMPVGDSERNKDDAGRPDPKFFRLWKHVIDKMTPSDKVGKRWKPESLYGAAESALATLASQWKILYEEMRLRAGGAEFLPPVLIVVCDNTELSKLVFEMISGERVKSVPDEEGVIKATTVFEGSKLFPELANSEGTRHTIRIDSKLLGKLEGADGQTRDEAALALRTLIDTVGKRGLPGEQVRCVVSVSMLTEGWDANNVTHILGIRAFGTQLLCEQVVGRGLRRMNYEVNPEGFMEPEYADIYGIPFSLIPFQKTPEGKGENTPEYHRVYTVPGREKLRLTMPIVESYTYDLRSSGIECDVDTLEGMIVNVEPTEVFLSITRGYEEEGARVDSGDFIRQTRAEFYEQTRFQQVIFRIAQQITDDLVMGVREGVPTQLVKETLLARHQVFPDVVRILGAYVEKRVTFGPGVDRRELALERYARLVRERVRAGIYPAAGSKEAPLLPVVNTFQETTSTDGVDEQTTRPTVPLVKSELNAAVVLSEGKGGDIGEVRAIEVLEDLDRVEAFAPNTRKIGFQIPWEYLGHPRRYEPDFLVRMRGGTIVVLEIKGGKGELHGEDEVLAKNAAARKWVAAVNNAKRYGTWAFEICRELPKLREQLIQHSAELPGYLPYRRVEPDAAERYRSCVPMLGLLGAVRRWQKPALMDLGDPNVEWVTWNGAPAFADGMFVAPVAGKYALFQPSAEEPAEGGSYLLYNAGIADPDTDAPFTVRTFTVEPPTPERSQARIVLKGLREGDVPIVIPGSGVVKVVASFAGWVR
ncbi:MAG: hypothetical protein V4850_17790 [Myxococcota bacterium]